MTLYARRTTCWYDRSFVDWHDATCFSSKRLLLLQRLQPT